ncbi:MAG: hypothetical protein P0120_08870 [Nitrospira sp.]|nr:hypothetical protein [Nitrospira sp.]
MRLKAKDGKFVSDLESGKAMLEYQIQLTKAELKMTQSETKPAKGKSKRVVKKVTMTRITPTGVSKQSFYKNEK